VLPAVCAELTALSSQIVLVLDDYHLITNPEIDECLVFFVDHLPQNLELVLASRSESPLPLARMRAGGDLVEIDAQRLSFTEQGADLLQREASRNRSVSARLRISNLHSALAIYLMPRRLN
jgi:LuxR family transcriptional regulator, maltose regulon positive regulatory protein